jgi:hypothetical protein
MDPRNPHNSYYYKPLDQAAPIYVPPSHSTQRILPVPQEAGKDGREFYGMPGQARPIYIPDSADIRKEKAANMKNPHGPEVAMSDRHSKEEIQRLSSKNDALTAALDQAHAQTGGQGNLPPTEYPRLPAHTNFPTSPQENQVTAQNAGIQQSMRPPPGPPPQMGPPPQPLVPTPQAPQGAPSPGFNVQNGPPDLSQLDEAYRRIGSTQGG